MADSKTDKKLPNDPAGEIDTALVRQLADILNDTELTEIEVERGDLKIRVARELTVAAARSSTPPPRPRPLRRPPPLLPPCRRIRPPSSRARAKR